MRIHVAAALAVLAVAALGRRAAGKGEWPGEAALVATSLTGGGLLPIFRVETGVSSRRQMRAQNSA